jgi:hypothetical protein
VVLSAFQSFCAAAWRGRPAAVERDTMMMEMMELMMELATEASPTWRR